MTPTTKSFEDQLFDALIDRFDGLAHRGAAAPAPLPRRHGRRYTVLVGCLAGAATATSVVLAQGGPTPALRVESHVEPAPTTHAYALADWTSRPTRAGRAQVAAADNRCTVTLGAAGSSSTAPDDKQGPPLAGGPWRPVLVDTRSDLTLSLYSDGTGWLVCLTGPTFVWLNAVDAAGPPVGVDSAAIDKVSIREAAGDGFTFALGRSGAGVTGVGLVRSDGSVVNATVGNGRFIAWWPEALGVKGLEITTSAGTTTSPVAGRFDQSRPQSNNKIVRSIRPSTSTSR